MEVPKIKLPLLKEELETRYAKCLSPFATKIPRKNSRQYNEGKREQENRTDFQRDRDRIIHSKAFRRLMYKTQVFVNHEGDHFRTRLTHTLEVAQLSRGISKSLGVNEELAEAIALGHDLGHTPFGHAVERYLDKELSSKGMGRFYHNEQSVRIVDYIEKRCNQYEGINLTYEVREGILKHNKHRSGIYPSLNPEQVCSTIEGQIVDFVDTIAYTCHDLQDAITSGFMEEAMYKNKDFGIKIKELIALIAEILNVEIKTININRYSDTYYIGELIHTLVMCLTEETVNNIEKLGVNTELDVMEHASRNKKIVVFNVDKFYSIKKITEEIIYGLYTIEKMDKKAVQVVKDVFEDYTNNPKLLPPDWLYRYEHVKKDSKYDGAENNKIRVICDYISTMTDRYALEVHDSLRNPRIRV